MKTTKKKLSLILSIMLITALWISPVMAEEVYVVQPGDVLWKIAENHGTTWEKLAEINELDNPHLIFAGQKINLIATVVIEENFIAENIEVMSRGTNIPAVFTYPKEGSNFPLVVMAHGHGGSKDEAGGYINAAKAFAENGIATIRMDFPGCGDSTESFYHNSLTNMMLDIDASLEYALTQNMVNESKIGIFGYSMGGRLAMLSVAKEPRYDALALWAPAATNGNDSMHVFMGGKEAFEGYNTEAQNEGMSLFTTLWGSEQLLSKQFFDDMTESKPLDEVASYTGPVIIVNGDLDPIIDRPVIDAAIAGFTSSSDVQNHVVVGADHGFGIFSGQPELTNEAIKAVVDFMVENLK